jgi:glutamine---fructose-6-phosphate transaminase (isomerizing)
MTCWGPITPRIDRLDWSPDLAELGDNDHYMQKEIREQPDTVRDACRGRLRRPEGTAAFGGLNMTPRQLRRVRRVDFAACGTSWHAALVGEYLIERLPTCRSRSSTPASSATATPRSTTGLSSSS